MNQDTIFWNKLRARAIQRFRDIQGGAGVDKSDFPEELKGEIAKDWWHNPEFSLGIEYGVLIALYEFFNLSLEDLK